MTNNRAFPVSYTENASIGCPTLHAAESHSPSDIAIETTRWRTDWLFYIAVALSPVDGTILGMQFPFWTPLSPWFFMLYTLVNYVFWKEILRKYWQFFALFGGMIVLAVVNWFTVAFHPVAASKSLLAVFMGLCCLASLYIAWNRRVRLHTVITIVVVSYWFALLCGVVQIIAIHWQLQPVIDFFSWFMKRSYIDSSSAWGGGRPQFLFAEPSYIGMHLYGVLLPLYWLDSLKKTGKAYGGDRRLPVLITVFALVSIFGGAGVRIILDTIIVAVCVAIVATDFRKTLQRVAFMIVVAAAAACSVIAVVFNDRLRNIVSDVVVDHSWMFSDGSFTGRIVQTMIPAAGWLHDIPHLVLGFGPGNIGESAALGFCDIIPGCSADGDTSQAWFSWYLKLIDDSNQMFTMSAYTSLISEYGIAMFAILCALLAYMCRKTTFSGKFMLCWLLLIAYLYVQFEGYAFYALWLWIFIATLKSQNFEVTGEKRKR